MPNAARWSTANNSVSFVTEQDFFKGKADGLTYAHGALRLLPGRVSGTFTTSVLELPRFDRLVSSWNAKLGGDARLTVCARVRIGGSFTDWLSFGEWSEKPSRASADTNLLEAFVDTDVLTVKDGKCADAVELAVTLFGSSGASAALFGLHFSCMDSKLAPLPVDRALPESVRLAAPVYSQMIREPDMASVMCSAVTATALMNFHGGDLIPEQTALLCYDAKYQGFGNWAFTMAAASAFGFSCRLAYADLDFLRAELAAGRPVGVNVAYSSVPGKKQPFLTNGAAENTNGHLMTLTGYGTEGGTEYFDCHDSAAVGDASCVRRYRADEFDAAWGKKLAYVMTGRTAAKADFLPERIPAALVPSKEAGAYDLVAAGKRIPLAPDFYEKRLTAEGGGLIACRISGDESSLPTGVLRTGANSPFYYNTTVTENGSVRPDPRLLDRAKSEGRTLEFYCVCNDGRTYAATL